MQMRGRFASGDALFKGCGHSPYLMTPWGVLRVGEYWLLSHTSGLNKVTWLPMGLQSTHTRAEFMGDYLLSGEV